MFFEKKREKVNTSENPIDTAISDIAASVFFSIYFALFSLMLFRYFFGERFSYFINRLYKYRSLIPTESAISVTVISL